MRIAIIAPLVTPIREPQRGGSQSVVADLARGLTERGHAVELYAATGSAISGVTVIDTGVKAESLAGLLYRADGHQPADDGIGEQAFRTVYEAVRRVPYDVVHNHAFDAPAVREAMEVDWPVVHTLHLPPDPAMTAALNDARRSVKPPIVAAVSASSAEAWQRVVRIDVVLHNGVPIDRIPWSDKRGSGLLFAGRFSPEKGAADAIAIAQQADQPLDLYGEAYDEEYFREQIEPHAKDRGVTLRGSVPRTELWSAMARCLAVVYPAKWDEPFGMAAAEAQAAGTPVVAYDAGALPEVIADGKTGFLVRPGDIAGAARAAAEVASIDRANCRRHAEATLNLDDTVAAHEALYRQIQARARATWHG